MPGGSKKGGGLVASPAAYKPFKMRGTPFQRNFGIGMDNQGENAELINTLQNEDAAKAAADAALEGAITGEVGKSPATHKSDRGDHMKKYGEGHTNDAHPDYWKKDGEKSDDKKKDEKDKRNKEIRTRAEEIKKERQLQDTLDWIKNKDERKKKTDERDRKEKEKKVEFERRHEREDYWRSFGKPDWMKNK